MSACLLFVFAFCSLSNAFWEQGHHVIAVMAYEQLEPDEQAELIRILKHHPRFEQDFTIPESIKDDQEAIHRWWIGQAGYWPDLVRGNEKYDRPTWHYQLGATLVIGDVDVPDDPGPLPQDATLETQELYIVQTIELCKKVFHDKTQADADRAIALCWLAHLVADAHQPCHAGSLYSPIAFPDGDRGANGIPIRGQGNIRNLHAFWDSLLGDKATPESVDEKVTELRNRMAPLDIKDRTKAISSGELQSSRPPQNQSFALKQLDLQSKEPADWIRNGRLLSRESVYTKEVVDAVSLKERGLVEQLSSIEFGDGYPRSALKISSLFAELAADQLTQIFGSMELIVGGQCCRLSVHMPTRVI